MEDEWIAWNGEAATGEPFITIRSNGTFGISKSCYQKFFSGYPYVELFFNPKQRKIGFRPVKEKTPKSYKITSYKKRPVYTVAGARFLKSLGIQIGKLRRFRAEKEGELIVIDLDKEGK